ncbi:hypothetical protein Tco_1292018 [Tanacetum coccineum]
MVKPVWNNAQRVNHQNFAKKTHPCAKKYLVPRAVLMKSGLVSINTARQNISKTAVSVNTARQVNTAHSKTTVNAARPMSYLSKTPHSIVKRPINNNTTFKNSNFNQWVNTVKDKNVNAVRPKTIVNIARPKAVVNTVQGNNVNVVKASACWVWKPKTKVLDHVSKHNSASTILKRFDYIDAQGRSKHMTMEHCPIYHTMKEIDRDLLLLEGTQRRENHKEKLIDESQVLLRVPRKNNMYNVDLKNIVPKRGNLVRGLPSKLFENDETYVACQKGKHHKAYYPQKGFFSHDDGSKPCNARSARALCSVDEDPRKDSECNDQEKEDNVNSTNNVNAASTNEVNVVGGKTSIELPDDPNMPALEDYSIFDFTRDDEDDGVEADMNNLNTTIQVSPNPTIRIHKDHPLDQVIGDLQSATQTRKMSKNLKCNMGFGKIEEEVYVCQKPPGYEIQTFLIVQQKKDGIFISQDKYVGEILKKFGFTEVKTASTPMETQKPLLKDEDGEEVDVHMYRSMIGSLMYLTSSRPDIMFAVCACARYQVNPKVSHLHAVKMIFSDYAGASLDRKSTTGGCQFLRSRLISWQFKKQTMVANSTTKAEYVAASSCRGQVLWIQNQLLNYGDCNEKKLIQMVKIHTDKNVADLLTKSFDIFVLPHPDNGGNSGMQHNDQS